MRVRRVTPGPLFPDDGPRGARLQRRAKGIAIEAGGVRRAHPGLSAGAAGRGAGGPGAVARSAQAVDGGPPGLHGVVVPVRRAARDRRPGGHLPGHRRTPRPRLAEAPAPGLRPAHPLGPQPPGGRTRAVRADLRDRGPRAGRARARAHPHPAREHHRQRASRRRDRARARARPAVRDQARAADAPDDRHRRALGAHELRAASLRRPGRRGGSRCGASRTISARARASSSIRRALATPPRSSLARRR